MEVVNDNSALLSNYELFSLLTDIKLGQNGQKAPGKRLPNLATITYSTLKYLEGTPACDQSAAHVSQFIQALSPFNLTKAEKLQLLNLRPTTAVEIQLIIEESEERLSEEQIEELLDVVAQHLPDK